jgi:recombination protein RecR
MSNLRDSGPLHELIERLKALPGIGPRTAERLAFHVLKQQRAEALALADAIRDVKERLHPCKCCFNLADDDLCTICRDGRRDHGVVFVVEQPKDLLSLEATGLIEGVYHVLMGRIAPLDGVGPEDLTIGALIERCRGQQRPRGAGEAAPEKVREVVLATNPTVEGDATALHIMNALRDTGVKVTRLARGLAPGGQIEYANRSMLEEALRGRREV